jgi:hypothetical protein
VWCCQGWSLWRLWQTSWADRPIGLRSPSGSSSAKGSLVITGQLRHVTHSAVGKSNSRDAALPSGRCRPASRRAQARSVPGLVHRIPAHRLVGSGRILHQSCSTRFNAARRSRLKNLCCGPDLSPSAFRYISCITANIHEQPSIARPQSSRWRNSLYGSEFGVQAHRRPPATSSSLGGPATAETWRPHRQYLSDTCRFGAVGEHVSRRAESR